MKSAAFKLSAALAVAFALAAQVRADGAADRAFWVDSLVRIANPVVTNLAAGTLHASMPRRAGTWSVMPSFGSLSSKRIVTFIVASFSPLFTTIRAS